MHDDPIESTMSDQPIALTELFRVLEEGRRQTQAAPTPDEQRAAWQLLFDTRLNRKEN